MLNREGVEMVKIGTDDEKLVNFTPLIRLSSADYLRAHSY